MVLVAVSGLLLPVTSAPLNFYVISADPETQTVEVLSAEDLLNEPNHYIDGNTGEFTFSFEPGAATLNWNHSPNNTILWAAPIWGPYSSSSDYAVMYLDFSLIPNQFQYEANISIAYSVELTGDFGDSESIGSFCRAATIVQNALGEWNNIMALDTASGNGSFVSSRDLSGSDLYYYFSEHGMTRDDSNESQQVGLGIGVILYPTSWFLGVQENSTGSVQLTIQSIIMYAESIVEPLDGMVAKADRASVIEGRSHAICRGSGLTPEGSMYSIIDDPDISSQLLLSKWGDNNAMEWQTEVPSSESYIIVRIAVASSGIYLVVLTRNDQNEYVLVFYKFSVNGNLLWEQYISCTNFIGITSYQVDNQGNTYLLLTNGTETPHAQLLSLDRLGSIRWNEDMDLNGKITDYANDLAVSAVGNSFILTAGTVQKWDSEGHLVWVNETRQRDNIAVDSDENFYLFSQYYSYPINISKFSKDSSPLWTLILQMEIIRGHQDRISEASRAISWNNHLYILVYSYTNLPVEVLVDIAPTGEVQYIRFLSFGSTWDWQLPQFYSNVFISSSGIMHFIGTSTILVDNQTETALVHSTYSGFADPFLSTSVVETVAAVGVVAAVFLFERRIRHKQKGIPDTASAP
jgi:hypothetical protein